MKKLVGDNPEKDFAVLNKEAAAIEGGDESSIEISQKSSKRDSFVIVFNPQFSGFNYLIYEKSFVVSFNSRKFD